MDGEVPAGDTSAWPGFQGGGAEQGRVKAARKRVACAWGLTLLPADFPRAMGGHC
jgi:hypothetical protein